MEGAGSGPDFGRLIAGAEDLLLAGSSREALQAWRVILEQAFLHEADTCTFNRILQGMSSALYVDGQFGRAIATAKQCLSWSCERGNHVPALIIGNSYLRLGNTKSGLLFARIAHGIYGGAIIDRVPLNCRRAVYDVLCR